MGCTERRSREQTVFTNIIQSQIFFKKNQRHGINGMAQYDIADLCALKHTPLGCAVTLGLLGGFTSLWLS